MCTYILVCMFFSHVWLFVTPARLLCAWNPPGKNPGVGCHFLLQRIFLTQDRTQVSCIAGRFFTVWTTSAVWGTHSHYSHWTDEETEAQRGQVVVLRLKPACEPKAWALNIWMSKLSMGRSTGYISVHFVNLWRFVLGFFLRMFWALHNLSSFTDDLHLSQWHSSLR